MRIQHLEVRNLKSIETLSWEPNPGLNVLIGQNNAGKSTLINALRVLQCSIGSPWPFSTRVSEIATDKDPNSTPSITMKVLLTPEDLSRCHSVFHADETHTVIFTFEIPMATKDPKILLQEVRTEPKFARMADNFLFRHLGPDHYNVANTSGLMTGKHPQRDDVYHQLQLPLDDAARFVGLDPIRLILSEMFFYDPHRKVPTAIPIAGPNRLLPSGDNLARCLADRLQEQDHRIARLEHLMQEISPGLGKLVVKRLDHSNIWCGFQTLDVAINLAEMGTGFQQLVALGYQLIFREATVLAIEEPEVHLHPAAQRALNRAIREASKQCQVLVVTHSPLFVDRQSHSSNWIVALDEGFRTHLSTLGSNDPLRPVRNALGLTVGDSLYSGDAILLVEGATEMVCLPKLAELAESVGQPSLELDRVLMVNAGGAENIRSMLRILKRFDVPIVLLIDRTHRANQIIESCVREGLTSLESVVFVEREDGGTAEFEDLLPQPTYLKAFHQITGVDVDATEIGKIRDETAAMRGGHAPSLPTILERVLGREYDKVDVALKAVQELEPEWIPSFFTKLVKKLTTVLG